MSECNNLFFDENYEILSFDRYNSGEKKFIGNGTKCRFCENDKSKTTFSNESHAIPESIGNKKIILRDECDICNRFFSENLEDHFDKYTKPYRTFARIKGKKKYLHIRVKTSRLEYQLIKNKILKFFFHWKARLMSHQIQ